MYDTGKILAGLILFVGLITLPFWFGSGGSEKAPQPAIRKAKGDKCVESAAFMRSNHMQLLDEWRDEVVRDNSRTYSSVAYGTTFNKSLSNTCMDCHSNKAEFCDSCHDYSSVRPYCWECHVEPKETD